MKVAVTGHSGGLGKAIADRLGRAGHEVVGFSLDNGYDICSDDGFRRIVDEALDCDVFVNCAYDWEKQGFGQVNVLIRLFHRWENDEKHIINIGSIAPDFYSPAFLPSMSKYRAAKAALDTATREIHSMGKPCRVTIVRPDWFDSVIATDYERKYGVKLRKLACDEVAHVVAMIIDLGPKVTISSLTLASTIHRSDGPRKAKKWWKRRQ